MKLPLRKIYLGISGAFLIAVFFFSLWQMRSILQDNTPSFTAYYSATTIAGFDVAGNPTGPKDIYRLDGLHGTPKKIFSSLDAQAQVQFEKQKLNVTTVRSIPNHNYLELPIGLIQKLDHNGRVVGTEATDKPQSNIITGPLTTSSPNGRYIVTTSLSCSKEVFEGPCPTIFSLRIYDTSADKTLVLKPQSFSLPDDTGMNVRVLDYISNTDVLVQINDTQELNRQVLGKVNLATGTFTLIEKNFSTFSESSAKAHTFQWLQPDHETAIMVERNLQSDTADDRFVKYNIVTRQIDAISDELLGYNHILSKNLQGYYYLKQYNEGEWYFDFMTKTSRQITLAGNVEDFDPNERFVPITVYESSNGLGPKKVYIQDLSTNKARLVFDQTVNTLDSLDSSEGKSQNPGQQDPRIGKVLYNFIGIDQ